MNGNVVGVLLTVTALCFFMWGLAVGYERGEHKAFANGEKNMTEKHGVSTSIWLGETMQRGKVKKWLEDQENII